MKIIALLVMAALATGCERDSDGRTKAMRDNDERLSILDSNRRYEEAKASGENCLKRGGLKSIDAAIRAGERNKI